jgi:hypothetical protein
MRMMFWIGLISFEGMQMQRTYGWDEAEVTGKKEVSRERIKETCGKRGIDGERFPVIDGCDHESAFTQSERNQRTYRKHGR